jgi:membrane protein YqaA with SNARE-associated domain
MLEFWGKLDDFEHLRSCTGEDTIALLLVTSGLAHLPPIKVVTILSGVVGISLTFFILSCIVARGARFLALAWAMRRFGEPIRSFIETRLGTIAAVAAAVIIALWFAAKYFGGGAAC